MKKLVLITVLLLLSVVSFSQHLELNFLFSYTTTSDRIAFENLLFKNGWDYNTTTTENNYSKTKIYDINHFFNTDGVRDAPHSIMVNYKEATQNGKVYTSLNMITYGTDDKSVFKEVMQRVSEMGYVANGDASGDGISTTGYDYKGQIAMVIITIAETKDRPATYMITFYPKNL